METNDKFTCPEELHDRRQVLQQRRQAQKLITARGFCQRECACCVMMAITKDAALKLKQGQKIRVYDDCSQCDRIEEVVRVVNNRSYDEVYIYSIRESWRGYDERLSTISGVKEVLI